MVTQIDIAPKPGVRPVEVIMRVSDGGFVAIMRLWRAVVHRASFSTGQGLLIVVTALAAAFSELFTIALIQPVLSTFTPDGFVSGRSPGNSGLVALLQKFDDTTRVIVILGLILLCQVLREVFSFASDAILISVRTKVEMVLREQTYRKSLAISAEDHAHIVSGELQTVLNALPRAAAGFIFIVLGMIPTTVMLAIYIYAMLNIEWRLFAFLVAAFGVTFFLMRFIYSRQSRLGALMRNGLVAMASKVDELNRALPVIRAFGQEERAFNSYMGVTSDYLSAQANSSLLTAALGPVQRTFSLVLIFTVLFAYYSATSLGGQALLTMLVPFLFVLIRLNGPLSALNMQRASLSQAQPYVTSLLDFLDRPEEREGGLKPEKLKALRFENVSFRYGDAVILSNINLEIRRGEFVGLVGPSGAGKTTLANLVCGFAKATSGHILLNSSDFTALDLKAWRRKIALVPQRPYLFDGTIAENIRYGRPSATDNEIKEAARLAGAETFISGMPSKYDSAVGEGGSLLSGGQIQRIAIARALLTEPDLLILDEATSAQDTQAENVIRETVEGLRGKITIIVIAHRLSSVVYADRIAVMNQGMIAEIGPHRDLVERQDGIYRHLYALSMLNVDIEKGSTKSKAPRDDASMVLGKQAE